MNNVCICIQLYLSVCHIISILVYLLINLLITHTCTKVQHWNIKRNFNYYFFTSINFQDKKHHLLINESAYCI